MKKKLYSLLALLPLTAAALSAQTLSDTLAFTGGIQTFTVPCGITSIHIDAYGAQGGAGATGGNSATGGLGGFGGVASGDLAVTPGQVINIFVGGLGTTPTGGFNGGANGGSTNAGGGGGATDVRVNGTALTDRILIAGGGGGGGRAGCETNTVAGGNGGVGNGTSGNNGTDAPTPGGVAGGGAGGTISAGGAAGIGCGGFLGAPGTIGTSGNGGVGGAGQSCCCFSFPSIPGGGGGGGGLMGGGGGGGGSAGTTGCSGNDKGAGGGGAGGSCSTSGVTNGVIGTPNNIGNGWVVITYADQTPLLPVLSGTATVCSGTNVTISATNSDPNADFYTWTVPVGLTFLSGQNTNTIMVGTAAAGTYSITVTGNDSCVGPGPMATFVLTVNALPTVALVSTPSEMCISAGAAALVGTPPGGTFSGPGVTGSSFDPAVAGVGTHDIDYTFTDANGCTNADTISVTVNALPVVSATSTPSTLCLADANGVLAGTPSGGTFSGPGVTGNSISPTAAGSGTHNIVYTYTDANGCANTDTVVVIVDACLGMAQNQLDASIELYPNPTKGVLNISVNKNVGDMTIEIVDVEGRVVFSSNEKNVQSGFVKQVSMEQYPNGNYMIKLKANGQQVSHNVTLQK